MASRRDIREKQLSAAKSKAKRVAVTLGEKSAARIVLEHAGSGYIMMTWMKLPFAASWSIGESICTETKIPVTNILEMCSPFVFTYNATYLLDALKGFSPKDPVDLRLGKDQILIGKKGSRLALIMAMSMPVGVSKYPPAIENIRRQSWTTSQAHCRIAN